MVLRAEHQTARMSEIKTSRLGLYSLRAEYSKCNNLETLGLKGLKYAF